MESKKDKSKKKATIYGSLAVVAIVVFAAWTIMFHIPKPVIEPTDEGTWHVIWRGSLADAAENDPGAGASGFLEIFYVNHTASPATAYDENTSTTIEGWCTAANLGYATADEYNIEISHSVTFDIVVRVRFNKTHCWNGTDFIGSRTRVNFTASGDLTIADETGTNVETDNSSAKSYIWINVYWDNSGSGYSINADETFDNDEISIEAKY